MEPSAYALNELKRRLAIAEKESVQAKTALHLAKESLVCGAAALAKCKVADLDEASNPDYNIKFAPEIGVEVSVACKGAPAISRQRESFVRAQKNEKIACSACCSLRDLMETDQLRKFRLFVSETCGKEPTAAKIEQAFKDWLQLRAAHTCPV